MFSPDSRMPHGRNTKRGKQQGWRAHLVRIRDKKKNQYCSRRCLWNYFIHFQSRRRIIVSWSLVRVVSYSRTSISHDTSPITAVPAPLYFAPLSLVRRSSKTRPTAGSEESWRRSTGSRVSLYWRPLPRKRVSTGSDLRWPNQTGTSIVRRDALTGQTRRRYTQPIHSRAGAPNNDSIFRLPSSVRCGEERLAYSTSVLRSTNPTLL